MPQVLALRRFPVMNLPFHKVMNKLIKTIWQLTQVSSLREIALKAEHHQLSATVHLVKFRVLALPKVY
ncbi:MAG TPA: hypothetical protein VJL89_13445 [Thermodesulfovibrionia bacterium]|nr:hypothetical protein [Thermodesulfovibrionia bacterium]